MGHYQLPDGVGPATIDTDRLRIQGLATGPEDGEPVVFLHGNLTTSLFWDETLAALPDRYRGVAIDFRGFGATDALPIDATRGVGDLSDDVGALLDALGAPRAHLVGWSTGGAVAMRHAADHPDRVASITLIGSVPPHGFGGTTDPDGTPVNEDYSGTGAGIMPAETLDRIRAGDRTTESDFSPRMFMNAFYWKQGFTVGPAREDAFVEAILTTVVGDDNEPGDVGPSEHWPGFSPGRRGILNALCGKYANVLRLVDVDPKPPILWVQGSDDLVVSDTSSYDMGYLGQLGAVPGWPGADVYPPQPMIAQMRVFLDRYQSAGGGVERLELAGAGHGAHIDHASEFDSALASFLPG
jgi:pimeloyl-ACP methyl ester carboxylesterase